MREMEMENAELQTLRSKLEVERQQREEKEVALQKLQHELQAAQQPTSSSMSTPEPVEHTCVRMACVPHAQSFHVSPQSRPMNC